MLLLLRRRCEILGSRRRAADAPAFKGASQSHTAMHGIWRVLLHSQRNLAVWRTQDQLGDLLRLQLVNRAAVHLAQQVAGGREET